MNVFISVDDELDNIILFEAMLHSIDPSSVIISLQDPVEAITLYSDIVRHDLYTVAALFLDYSMPELTGADVAEILYRTHKQMCPMFILTADSI